MIKTVSKCCQKFFSPNWSYNSDVSSSPSSQSNSPEVSAKGVPFYLTAERPPTLEIPAFNKSRFFRNSPNISASSSPVTPHSPLFIRWTEESLRTMNFEDFKSMNPDVARSLTLNELKLTKLNLVEIKSLIYDHKLTFEFRYNDLEKLNYAIKYNLDLTLQQICNYGFYDVMKIAYAKRHSIEIPYDLLFCCTQSDLDNFLYLRAKNLHEIISFRQILGVHATELEKYVYVLEHRILKDNNMPYSLNDLAKYEDKDFEEYLLARDNGMYLSLEKIYQMRRMEPVIGQKYGHSTL